MDYSSPERYDDLVLRSELADHSETRGCMTIRPYGYAIWEIIKEVLDKRIKATGHVNGYFPLLIPKSLLEKEAAHVKGFAKQCAVVTHYRLKASGENGSLVVDPDAKLTEELIVRPTSEAIIWPAYKRWIKSYRDLPLMINNWANVVRWEMRPKLFLRTAEFLWQECHTAHETEKEAREETVKMLHVLSEFINEVLAIPTLLGMKTETERFAGAEATYTIETLLQDGKALQAGTSHFFGRNFSKAYDVMFTNRQGEREYVWGTTWGVSTRLIGAIVMTHSDEFGLILPPKIAPVQVVIIPTFKSRDELIQIDEQAEKIIRLLREKEIRVKYDNDTEIHPGKKFAHYELKGFPLRAVIGPRELQTGSIELTRRDTREKSVCKLDTLSDEVINSLNKIQKNIFDKAENYLHTHTANVNSFDQFKKTLKEKKGFILAHWDGTSETELKIKEETGATIRCIPFNRYLENGFCVYSKKPSTQLVYFAKAH